MILLWIAQRQQRRSRSKTFEALVASLRLSRLPARPEPFLACPRKGSGLKRRAPCVRAAGPSMARRFPKRTRKIAAAKQLGHPWPRTVLLSRQFSSSVSALSKGTRRAERAHPARVPRRLKGSKGSRHPVQPARDGGLVLVAALGLAEHRSRLGFPAPRAARGRAMDGERRRQGRDALSSTPDSARSAGHRSRRMRERRARARLDLFPPFLGQARKGVAPAGAKVGVKTQGCPLGIQREFGQANSLWSRRQPRTTERKHQRFKSS